MLGVGSTVPTPAEIELSGKGRMPLRGGVKHHPLLGVVADDELFCERAKNIRESCMKETAGN